MGVRSPDVHEVRPTTEEIAAWNRRHPNRQGAPGYRVACNSCGHRFWLSGIGIGAHRRACKGAAKQ